MKIDRLLAITILMLNHEKVSSRELSEKFEVSERTILRDMESINRAGIPVVSYPGRNGGYGIMQNYRIDRQLLTLDDMAAIVSALSGIHRHFNRPETELAINKVKSLIPLDKQKEVQSRSRQVVFDIVPWGVSEKSREYSRKIYQAITGYRTISFTYHSWKEESAERKVEPVTLLFKGFGWYLFAYCLLRKDYRLFKLSRIKNLEILQDSFIPRDADYHDYISWDEEKIGKTRFKLKFQPRMKSRLEEIYDVEQMECQKDGSWIVTTEFPEDEWVYSILLSYGENMEVLEPAPVRKILLDKSKKIQNIYSQNNR